MALEQHPLSGKDDWQYNQPASGVSTYYVSRDLSSGEETVRRLAHFTSCRENLISYLRQALQRLNTNKEKYGDRAWEVSLKQTHDIVLDDRRCRDGNHRTLLAIHDPIPNWEIAGEGDHVDEEEFLQVANIVVGLPAALLDPNRRSGDWWVTPLKGFRGKAPATGEAPKADGQAQQNYLRWRGVDNFVLRHPALLATLIGLYRQAYLLCACGFGPQVLDSVNHDDVVEAISEAKWKPIFALADQARPWINVPAAQNSSPVNYPFPWHTPGRKKVSYWQRFVRLQRAVRRHGYDEVLGEDLAQGWSLLNKGTQYTGAFSFWGVEKDLKDAHRRIMKLGKPLKRKKDGQESA